eukprot:2694539-Prymnesium_polylepis.1
MCADGPTAAPIVQSGRRSTMQSGRRIAASCGASVTITESTCVSSRSRLRRSTSWNCRAFASWRAR